MRFLLGLCIGTSLVFGGAFLVQQKDRILTSTQLAPDSASNQFQRPQVVVEHNVSEPVSATPAEIGPQVEPVDQAPQRESTEISTTAQAPQATDPLPDLDILESETISSEATPAQLASVWAPFHSEASANGFARRLESEIDQAFTVHRAGPANYHVVFPFKDEQERLRIAKQIAKVTGIPQS